MRFQLLVYRQSKNILQFPRATKYDYIIQQEEEYFPIREINFSQPKKSVKWHRLWNSLFHAYNIVSLRLGPYLKGECMNQKAKPHKQSLAVEDQNDIWVLGWCHFV